MLTLVQPVVGVSSELNVVGQLKHKIKKKYKISIWDIRCFGSDCRQQK